MSPEVTTCLGFDWLIRLILSYPFVCTLWVLHSPHSVWLRVIFSRFWAIQRRVSYANGSTIIGASDFDHRNMKSEHRHRNYVVYHSRRSSCFWCTCELLCRTSCWLWLSCWWLCWLIEMLSIHMRVVGMLLCVGSPIGPLVPLWTVWWLVSTPQRCCQLFGLVCLSSLLFSMLRFWTCFRISCNSVVMLLNHVLRYLTFLYLRQHSYSEKRSLSTLLPSVRTTPKCKHQSLKGRLLLELC